MESINEKWKIQFFEKYFQENLSKNEIEKCLIHKNRKLTKPLYQYTTVNHIEDLVCDNIMHVSRINELNDPFEGDLLCSIETFEIINGKSYKLTLDWEEVKKHVHIACFSENCLSNPMWAHYADRHKGVCIEYNFNNEIRDICFPVLYVNSTDNKIVCEKLSKNFRAQNRLLSEVFLKKGHDWSYEKEWRVIVPDNLPDEPIDVMYHNKHKYIGFLKPSAIYLGYKMDRNDEEYVKDLCQINNIAVNKIIKDKSGYNLTSIPL